MSRVKSNLAANFDVKLFGKFTVLIGWKFSTKDEYIKFEQQGYAKYLLEQHGYLKHKAV